MRRWTHLLCAACWDARNPTKRARDPDQGVDSVCCACGKPTSSGIYVRGDPAAFKCQGKSLEHDDGEETRAR